jgi:hypothetical protein
MVQISFLETESKSAGIKFAFSKLCERDGGSWRWTTGRSRNERPSRMDSGARKGKLMMD